MKGRRKPSRDFRSLPIFFFVTFLKILISHDLWARSMAESGQNLEGQGLISKILWNKDLASGRDRGLLRKSLGENLVVFWRI
jgi:hypothetical protein